jgi:hypothetical protein
MGERRVKEKRRRPFLDIAKSRALFEMKKRKKKKKSLIKRVKSEWFTDNKVSHTSQ